MQHLDLEALAADGFGHWFAGFIDGEGSFVICRAVRSSGLMYRIALAVELRKDDESILREIQERIGIGTFTDVRRRVFRGMERPSVRWHVGAIAQCETLVSIFDTFPLRAKKAADYAVWREAVRAQREQDWPRLALLRDVLREGRKFQSDPAVVPDHVHEQMTLP